MALPASLSGLSTDVATVGPFISSTGNVYVIGKNSSTTYKLQAQKSSDPSSVAFSAVGTDPTHADTTFVTMWISAFQVGDVIHVGWTVNSTINGTRVSYTSFNMSTDTWASVELVQSAMATAGASNANAWQNSILRRSDGTTVILYQGPRAAVMSVNYSRVVYARRTTGAVWTNNIAVDSGGAFNWGFAEAVLGASDRSHFFFNAVGSSQNYWTVTLTSANALQTAVSANTSSAGQMQGVGYVNGANTQIVASVARTTTAGFADYAFVSADTPTFATDTSDAVTGATLPARTFFDGTDVWRLYLNSNALYAAKSTNNGGSYGSASTAHTGTTISSADANLSMDGAIFTRSSAVVIPFVVNDNGTLKYNEYVVRTLATALTATSFAAGAAAFTSPSLGQTHALTATAFATASPSLPTPALGQVHGLSATAFTTGSAAFGTPTAVVVTPLTATSFTAGAAVFTSPSLAQTHVLTIGGLTVGAAAFTAPSIAQTHVLSAANFATGPPSLSTPTIAQVQALSATSFAVGAAAFGSPSLGQKHVLTTSGLTTSPAFGSPTLGQTHALTATSFATASPSLPTPSLGQIHGLSATSFAAGAAAFGSPSLAQVQALTASNFTASAAAFGSPTLSSSGGSISLTATSFTAGAAQVGPLIGPPLAPNGDAPTLYLDFKNGQYWVGSTAIAASDALDNTAPITAGVGWVATGSTNGAKFIGAALSAVLAGNWTMRARFSQPQLTYDAYSYILDASNSSWSDEIVIASETDRSNPNVQAWANFGDSQGGTWRPLFSPFNYANAPTGAKFNVDTMVTVAYTAIPARQSLSINGGTVVTNTTAQSGPFNLTRANFATYAGDAGSSGNAILTVESFALYPAQSDANLPGLTGMLYPASFTIGQTHVLTSSGLTVGGAAFTSPSLGQTHALSVSGLTTASPVFGAPSLAQVSSLSAPSFTTSAAAFTSPSLGQKHAVTASSFSTSAAIFNAPSLGQVHALSAVNLTTASPAFGAPSLAQAQVLSATSLTTSAAVFGAPTLGQTHVLSTNGLTTSPAVFGYPAFVQTHIFTAGGLTTTSPAFGSPSLGQVHGLTSAGLTTSPAFGSPTLYQAHLLQAGNLTLGCNLGLPTLGQVHGLQPVGLSVGIEFTAPMLHLRIIRRRVVVWGRSRIAS